MNWDEGIGGAHRAIAASTAARIGVQAGPGTGKTTYGLMRRVARLIQADNVAPQRILLISFTRVAASDLRAKVAELDVPGADLVEATTLHGFCLKLLLSQGVLDATRRYPRVLTKHEQTLMLRDIGDEFGDLRERRAKLKASLAAWARPITQLTAAPTHDQAAFDAAVRAWLVLHNAMLIGEVVPIAFEYLRTHTTAPERFAYDHIIVDEYQDLNALEQQLLNVLASNGSLCVIGDADQSIYGFKHAHPDGINEFLAEAGVDRHSMTECGRCPQTVLDMANDLMAHVPGRATPRLTARSSTTPGDVALVEWPTDVGEADGIADAIAGDIRSGRYSPADILVLTGRDTNGDRIRTALLARGIDAKSYFDQKAVDNDAANSALAFLRLVDNPDDAPALRLLLGAGSDTGRSAAYRKVIEVSRDERQTPAVVVERLSSGERLLKAPSLVACYNDAMERLPQLRLMDLPLLVAELMPGDVPDLADLRAIAVAALPGATSTSDFVKRVVVGVTQDEPPEHPDFVRVMSFHKSKGLTARSVHIVSAIAGIIPSDRAQWPDVAAMEAEEAEGRRLFYVAVTRAADSLVISWYSATTFQRARRDAITTRQPRTPHPRRGNSLEATFPSRFISELGASAPAPITGQAWLAARGI